MNELKRLMDADAFLGRGWSFPLELTEDGVKMSSYEKDIEESYVSCSVPRPASA